MVYAGPDRIPENRGNQLSVYLRRWWPSKFLIDNFQEIIVEDQTMEGLLDKVSKTSSRCFHDFLELKISNHFDVQIYKMVGLFFRYQK